MNDLRLAGLALWDRDPETGEQFTYTDKTGHFVVKLDGVVKGVPGAEKTPHVLEIKTHSEKSWLDVQKLGVKASKPMHYVQMQAGMWLSGLSRALYVALNKNNEAFYFERVHINYETIEKIQAVIGNMVEDFLTPAGISADASAYGCTFCEHKEVCVGKAKPIKTCRSCTHALPGEEGAWVCSLLGYTLTQDMQLRACDEYSPRSGDF